MREENLQQSTLPGKGFIHIWRDQKFCRQAEPKRVQNDKIIFTKMFKSGKEMVITGNVKIMKRNSSLERQIHSKGSKPMT